MSKESSLKLVHLRITQIEKKYFLQINIWPETFNATELQDVIPSFPFKHHIRCLQYLLSSEEFFLGWIYI